MEIVLDRELRQPELEAQAQEIGAVHPEVVARAAPAGQGRRGLEQEQAGLGTPLGRAELLVGSPDRLEALRIGLGRVPAHHQEVGALDRRVIGIPPDPAPMDFSAWVEVFLDNRWYTFDARHNAPRTGRIVVARGRDATDVPLINSFGPHTLKSFKVWTDEVAAPALKAASA